MDKMMKKLEDMAPDERNKLRQMLRQQGDTREEKLLDWMYKGEKPEAEEYLTGRKVDRYIDKSLMPTEDVDPSAAPGSTFTEEFLNKRADLDMQIKLREDPLYQIRREEEEAKKRLLRNPIKMKALQKIAEEQQKKLKKKKKKGKKKKKHKKSRHKSDSSDSSDSDDELINKYLAILSQKEKTQGESENVKNSPYEEDQRRDNRRDTRRSDQSPRHHHGDSKDHERLRHRSRERSPNELPRRSRSPQHRPRISRSPKYRRKSRSPMQKSRRSRSPPYRRNSKSPQHKSRRSPFRRTSTSPYRASRKVHSPRRKRSGSPRRTSARSRSPRRRQRPSSSSRSRSNSPERNSKKTRLVQNKESKKRLTTEEMDRKRAEMLENARWRDEQREQNVKRYHKEDEAEAKKLKHAKPEAFVKPLMMEHASHSSVEDRIKRNIYKIQRTNADLDKAFTKH